MEQKAVSKLLNSRLKFIGSLIVRGAFRSIQTINRNQKISIACYLSVMFVVLRD